MQSNISVTIDYLLDTGERGTLCFTPDQYFDLDEGDDVSDLTVDSTPKHREVRQYLTPQNPVLQARVQVRDAAANDLWEVTESYWAQFGEDGMSTSVREVKNGVELDWKKFVSIRFADGRERVLVLVSGDKFPLLDSYVVIEEDKHQGSLTPERGGLFIKEGA